jgi:succinate-acetate transporter protein
VASPTDGDRPTAVSLRPLGSPLPLGLAGLAVATFLYTGFQLGWIAQGERTVVGALLIAFPVPLQLTTSVLTFRARDGAAGSGTGILAASWLCIGVSLILSPPGSVTGALGLVLLAAGAALVLTALVTGLSKLVLALVILVAGVHSVLGGVYELGAGEGWQDASAVTGLALVALALYAAFAMELEDACGKTVAPLGRRGAGEQAMTGSLDDQAVGVEHEAGVRKRL